MLSKEALQEFKELYRNRYGVELGDAELSFRANNLVDFYKIVYGDQSRGPIKAKDAETKENPT